MGYRVFVTTSDKYLLALRPFAWLFNKYWSPEVEVIVGGFTPPSFSLPSNFHFMVLGEQEKYPVDRWSDAFIRMVEYLGDEIFAFMLEDYWITEPVDLRAVQMLYDYMRQFRYVIRMDLTTDRMFAGGAQPYGKVEDIELVKSSPGSPYHMSLMTAFWRTEHLMKILVPHESPWDIEIKGTTRLSAFGDTMLVLGTKVAPVKHCLAFRADQPGKLLLDGLKAEDIDEMRNLGLLEGLE